MMRFYLAASIVVSLLFAPIRAGAVSFDFAGSLGAANDFTLESGGISASFSSPSGPGTFAVAEPIGVFTYPVALGSYGSFGGDDLVITFSDPVVDRILIPFGVMEAYATAPATLVARANTGQTVVFTTAFNNLLIGAPQGAVTFMPLGMLGALTSLTLSSDEAFAIAGIDLPEPTGALLVAVGFAFVVAMRRRDRSRRNPASQRPPIHRAIATIMTSSVSDTNPSGTALAPPTHAHFSSRLST